MGRGSHRSRPGRRRGRAATSAAAPSGVRLPEASSSSTRQEWRTFCDNGIKRNQGVYGLLGALRAGVSESAGRKKGNAGTGNSNRYVARVPGEAAVSAGRTDNFLDERYQRIARGHRSIAGVGSEGAGRLRQWWPWSA
jgi:hypothetical protein